MRGAGAAVFLLAGVLGGGCATETTLLGTDPHAAASGGGVHGGGGSEVLQPAIFDPPKRGPDVMISVPAEAFAPVDLYFDNEGYLAGDQVVIDCSFEPFRTRMAAVSNSFVGQDDFVIREEGRDGDVLWVKLRNREPGGAAPPETLPTATFGSHREPPPVLDPATGKVVGLAPRPVFQFVATEELLIRFHVNSPPDRPVWFRALARGTPLRPDSDSVRDVIYLNVNRHRYLKGPELGVALDLHRSPDGAWGSTIDDPRPAGSGAEGR